MANFCLDPLEPRTLLASIGAAFSAPADPRTTVDLDPGWKFVRSNPSGASGKTFDDSKWSNVSLPHTWNALDGQDGGSNYYRGTGWYRKHLTPSTSLKGKRIFLKFDGADIDTDVYLNGTFVGSHKGGFAAFTFEVTSLIKPGSDNLLAVKVSNAYDAGVAPLSGDFNFDGGLYRDVSLIATNGGHIDLLDSGAPGVYLTPSSVSTASAKVNVKTKLKYDGASTATLSVETDIVDAAGKLVLQSTTSKSISSKKTATASQDLTVANPHLWNGVADPYLYTVYVIVKASGKVVDVLQQPLGLRYYKVDPAKGFFLNGKPYDLHGVAMHQDRLNKGFAISDADRAQDVSLIQEIGATFVRLSHYQHDQTTYNLLDKAGIVVWSEIPIVNSVSTDSAFVDNAKQQLRELIRQNYNHPAIMFWGLFNEISDNSKAATVIPQLNTLAHSEDATRPTTASTYIAISNTAKLNNYTDLLASNRYYGWYDGGTDGLGKWLDSFHSTNPTRPIGLSEYGAGASIYQHELDPKNVDPLSRYHPEEAQSLFHEQSWPQIAARPWVWEKAVWNMFDFASDLRSEGDTLGRNDKGLVTYDRKTKKDAFYYYKSQWSNQKFVYITSRRWTDRTDATTDVKVYSNCDTVDLIVNGQSLGEMTASNHVFVWHNVTLSPNGNAIGAMGTSGESAADDQVVWNLATGGQTAGGQTAGRQTAVGLQLATATLPTADKPLRYSAWKEISDGKEEV